MDAQAVVRDGEVASWEDRLGRAWIWGAERVLPWAVLAFVLLDAGEGLGPLPWWIALLAITSFFVMFIRGLGGAPQGWGAWPYTFALGAALSAFLLSPRSAVAGFRAGFADELAVINGQKPVGMPTLPPDPYEFWSTLLVTLVLGILFHRLLMRRRELQAQARLLDESRRLALQAKLAPHFIFNTLNTLHSQIPSDPAGAQATTERLAQLIRQVVAVADRPAIPLREELAFVEAYLGIERVRFGDRLSVRIEVPEGLEEAPVPPLSLQVLVENAVKHGVAPLERGGEVTVRAAQEGKHLVVTVADPGLGQGGEPGTGTALATLRQRLAQPGDLWMEVTDQHHVVGFRWRMA